MSSRDSSSDQPSFEHHDLFDSCLALRHEAVEAFRIINVLQSQGFIAYLAGGCVRDALLGKQPKDFDIATNATPESVRKVFGKPSTLAFGASFGVIGVLPPKGLGDAADGQIVPTEVATFRSDGDYSDGRRPDSVQFGDAREDAMRRDFTINGLFYDPHRGSVIDYIGGQDDLSAQVLRTIGSPSGRFGEDKLRMLRAIRFATTLGFQIDPETKTAISDHAKDISVVSGERIGAEMRRVLSSPGANDGLVKLSETGLAALVLPRLASVDLDRLSRLIKHLPDRSFPASLACVAIASDDAKPLLRQAAKDWKLSSEEIRQANAALNQHRTLIHADNLPWSTVQPTLVDRDHRHVLSVAKAVAIADQQNQSGIEKAYEAIQWKSEKLNPAPLMTGDDLRKGGIPPGPKYRVMLETIRRRQLDGQINTIEEAWDAIRKIDH